METRAAVSTMVMYEDESLEVHYVDGAQLQLSPCGCEFLLLKAAESRTHSRQAMGRVRQRTRFTISEYKELLVAALAFRNKYASQPYLPEELISAESKKPFFRIDSNVYWPDWSLSEAELGPGGEIIVRSKGGEATLMLASSGEDFSVEFMCNLSQNQSYRDTYGSSGGLKGDQTEHTPNGGKELTQSMSCSSTNICTQPKMYQSTTVVQHHSCYTVPSMWVYPLSLARYYWTAHVSDAEDGAETTSKAHKPDISSEARRSLLPQALPLTCPSPHLHRWKFKDPLATDEDSDLPTDLLKVMWCQGIIYRILNGTDPVIEVSPGDESVIRSNAVLNGYFTHYKYDLRRKKRKEVTYHVSSLPPDVLGQVYLVSSTVTRASSLLDTSKPCNC
ncbi:uncharacterized protein C5orf34 homolog isoform X1 [Gouania willdenowi]|uniref:uncharacterized protein C5orf34 homolog isoform X1 n=1 Tax=Gouania willdenowi TaxID=441366 RepID=UPI001055F579|nr:uncharacterized protein C5orf34 homolog isoform X1 [Gouania willdenowi]